MPYQMQCALCGIVWHREQYAAAPWEDQAPHIHTKADWDAYITANNLDPKIYTATPVWIKITGVVYPPLPDWPPENGSPPPGYPPAAAVTLSQRPDWKAPLDPMGGFGRTRQPRTPNEPVPAFLGPSNADALPPPPPPEEPPPPPANARAEPPQEPPRPLRKK